MDTNDIKLALTCRRLFLRNWRYPAPDDSAQAVRVNVEIFVTYEDSDSRGDDLANVVDYNLMRDALLRAGDPASPGFIERALVELSTALIVLASVEVRDKRAGTITIENRAIKKLAH